MAALDVDTPLVRRLRDALLAGAPAATAPGGTTATGEAVLLRITPFLETMYLMMVVDGTVASAERAAIRGALAFLSQGEVAPERLDALLEAFETRLAASSPETRLRAIGASFGTDRADRETAFSLAAAIALADDRVYLHEAGLLVTIGEWFGISERRARALLDAMD